jgi:4-hydroxy-2-oxoheptanedioate aldolase
VYRANSLKQRLRNGENVLGCWSMMGHPQVVEILSLAGFDFLVLDQEHGLGDPSSLAAQLHAMSRRRP